MPDLHFGWFTPLQGYAFSEYVPLALAEQAAILPAVAEGFDSLWFPDHLHAFDTPADPFLEAWTTMTWLAAQYPTLHVGNIVLAVGFRHPALLAKMGATLQTLTGGRFVMGIGGGWRAEEYAAYGYPFPPAAVRIKQLDEAVQLIRRMWTDPAPHFEGAYFQVQNAYCAPLPNPVPPIMIGGSGEQLLLPLVARAADIWDMYNGGTFDTVDRAAYTRKRDIVHRHAEAASRDPASIRQSVTIGQARLPQSAAESRQWADHLAALINLGITQFILDCGHVPSPDPVRRFHEEVITPLRKG